MEHSFELLKEINAIAPHVLAKLNNLVVGYALCIHPNFENDIPILQPMLRESERLAVAEYTIIGQICVAKEHRKKGVFRLLYATMTTVLSPTYTGIITEVDASNTRSLQAHLSVGFEKLSAYSSKGQDWEILLLPITGIALNT